MWFALLGAASAQVPVPELDSQLFRPSLDSRYTLWTHDSTRHEDHTILGRVVLHYTKNPLSFFADDGTTTRVVSDVVQADVSGGYQLGPARVGLTLPVVLYRDGQGTPSQTGFGDIAVDVKGTILQREPGRIGLGVLARLSLPTGDLPGLASNDATGEAQVLVDRDFGERWFGAVNAGVQFRPDIGIDSWTDTFLARLALGYKTSQMSGVSAELVSHGLAGSSLPSEVLLGGWGRAGKDLHLRGGVGTALGKGIGTPALRAMFALAFEPTFEPDTDGDGLSDFDDECPEVAEDLDGVEDRDGCPDPTAVTLKLVGVDGEVVRGATFLVEPGDATGKSGDTIPLQGGTFTFAAMAEDYEPTAQSLPVLDAAEQTITLTLEESVKLGRLILEVTDPEGETISATWTAPDSDYEQVPVTEEGSEVVVDQYDIRISADGFRSRRIPVSITEGETTELSIELQPSKVTLAKERIVIDESVFFELNKAVIKPESFELLDDVSAVILEHPELLQIRIEGHTDSRGPAERNQTLSQDRADSVRDYMIEKGVDPDRLVSKGFGENRPLEEGNNEAAWAKNRRVDFFVGKRAD